MRKNSTKPIIINSEELLLGTTAMTTTRIAALAIAGLFGFTGTAHAEWTDIQGNVTVDTSTPNTQVITSDLDRNIITTASADIYKGETVIVNQRNSFSTLVNRILDADPTLILGQLTSNGRIVLLNPNGVFFGQGARVDVSGLLASTGKLDTEKFLNTGAISLSQINSGFVTNEGTISVSDGGMAAFVAPSVRNSGVIVAKLGKVALASGDTVTVDMYGDGLVEYAVDAKADGSVVSNDGTISASKVALSTAAAKGVVDNVINMNGVIEATTVGQKGGKIILGGEGATVNVKGTLNASGENGGGEISVKAKDIKVEKDALMLADAIENGDGGNIEAVATNKMLFSGSAYARGGAISGNGGFVEVSGYEGLGYDGSVNTSAANGVAGSFLLDPNYAIIHSGWLDPISWYDLIIKSENLADDMQKNGTVTVQANKSIEVGTDLPLFGNGAIDLSKYDYNQLETRYKKVCVFGACTNVPYLVSVNYNGLNSGNLVLDSNVINFNKDLIMGTGNLSVKANTVNLNSKLWSFNGTDKILLGAPYISSTATLVNVLSNASLIQQGIYLANTGATVNVGAGTYNEDVIVDKDGLTIKGAANHASIIKPSSPAFVITGDNATVDGFTITGSTEAGVKVDGAANATVKNNVINPTSGEGVLVTGAANATVSGNVITGGYNGIHSLNSSSVISGNTVTGSGNIGIRANNTDGVARVVDVTDNTVSDFNKTGIFFNGKGLDGSVDNNTVTGRGTIDYVAQNGIQISRGANADVSENTVSGIGYSPDAWSASSILLYDAGSDVNVDNNTVTGTGYDLGVAVVSTETASVTNNKIKGSHVGVSVDSGNYEPYLSWGATGNSDNVIISGNTVSDTKSHGIYTYDVNGQTISDNTVSGTGENGIYTLKGGNVSVTGNTLTGTGVDGINVRNTTGAVNVTGNTITDAGDEGIEVRAPNTSMGFVTISGNTVTNSGDDGIQLAHAYKGALVSGNTSSGNLGKGSDGIEIKYSSSVKVYDNDVVDNYDEGIEITDVNGVLVDKNRVSGTGSDGILVTSTKGGYSEGPVILVKKASLEIANPTIYGTTVSNNNVSNNGDDGIDVENQYGAVISGNDVDSFGTNGIYLLNSDGSKILGNSVSNDGNGTGILVEGSSNVQVGADDVKVWVKTGPFPWMGYYKTTRNGNTVENVYDGIVVNGGKSGETDISVDNNDISKVVNGIRADHITSGLTITDNEIDGGQYGKKYLAKMPSAPKGDIGIEVIGSNGAIIGGFGDGNKVKDFNLGIDVDYSRNVQVKNNELSNVHNGVDAYRSAGVNISSNKINGNSAIGINVTDSDDANIEWNTVSHFDKGIKVSNSDDVNVGHNGISETNTGIEGRDSNRLDVYGNVVSADFAGVDLYNTDNVDIYGNTVNGADFGIRLNDGWWRNAISNADINGNNLYNGKFGIWADGVEYLTVLGNNIDGDTSRRNSDKGFVGIYVTDSSDVEIGNDGFFNGNNVNSFNTGVKVTDSEDVVIDSNRITDVNNGIWAENISSGRRGGFERSFSKNSGLVIEDNYIDGSTSFRGEGSGFGIYVSDSDGARIGGFRDGNTVEDFNNDGIRVERSDRTEVSFNDISDVDGDGISVKRSAGVYVNHNDIKNVGDDGIDVERSAFAGIFGNTVSGVRNNGIEVEDSFDADVIFNRVSFTGRDGIFVDHSVFADVRNNLVGFTGDDGIDARDSYGIDIVGNIAGLTGGDGIQVRDSSDAEISRNLVTFTGDDGIDVEGGRKVDIEGNLVSFARNNGIGVEYTDRAYITGNTSVNNGNDGIYINRVGHAEITGGNVVSDNGNNGIEAEWISTPTTLIIDDNDINNNGVAGIKVSGSPSTIINNNRIGNNGEYGLWVEGGFNGSVVLTGNTFTNNAIGARFESGEIDISDLDAPNTFIGGNIAMQFDPYFSEYDFPSEEGQAIKAKIKFPGGKPTGLELVDYTLGGTVFEGQTQYYVDLENGALFDYGTPGTPTHVIDGLNASYDGFVPASVGGILTPAQLAAIEGKLHDYDDENTVGQIFVGAVPGTGYFNRIIIGGGNGLNGARLTITGLPTLRAGGVRNIAAQLAGIAPAAGGEGEENLNDIAPAAGNDNNEGNGDNTNGDTNASCYSDAFSMLGNVRGVNFDMPGDARTLLQQSSNCGKVAGL